MMPPLPSAPDTAPQFADPAIAAVFASWPLPARTHLLRLRALIYESAARTEGVGPLEEALKWGQPAYLTPQSKSGTTLRLGLTASGQIALMTHCQSRVVPDFRDQFGTEFAYDGNRAVLLDPAAPLALAPLGLFVTQALTYHRRKTRVTSGGKTG